MLLLSWALHPLVLLTCFNPFQMLRGMNCEYAYTKGVCFFTNPQVDTCCSRVTSAWALPERGSLVYHPVKIYSLSSSRQDKHWPEHPAQDLQCWLKSSHTLPMLLIGLSSVYIVTKSSFCVKNIGKRNSVYYYRLHLWFLTGCFSICVLVLLSGSKFWHFWLETTVKMWKPQKVLQIKQNQARLFIEITRLSNKFRFIVKVGIPCISSVL